MDLLRFSPLSFIDRYMGGHVNEAPLGEREVKLLSEVGAAIDEAGEEIQRSRSSGHDLLTECAGKACGIGALARP
jgi:hypothetical protein